MHDLVAQVTSSLLPFPRVTIDALGEDEINLDSVLHGSFTVGRSGLAWLACGPHLEVVHAMTGERLSAYCFSGGGEQPPSVLAARDFGWLKRSGLLVGLEETEGSVLCLYDLGLSRVVKAVVIPGRITAIEPLVSYGGASTSTQHLHQSLRWFFGIAAVVTDLGHVLLVDLCLEDLSCSQSELEASDLQVVTKSPAEIPRLREISTRQGRHLCLQLNGPTGVGATALQYISRTNQLAVGFSDGCLQLWNMKTLKKEYHSQLEGGRVPVHAFTFQEPENDPRNCCYLWAVQSAQDLEGDMVSLRLLQLAFSERKCLASGKILYEGLEYCEERYSQELSGTAFPLRAQATNTRLLSCQTIEKFRPHPDRDDSMNEVASPDTSVSIFSWQVKAYGQGTPSTYVGVFDINRWYHAQMPDSLRTGESLQNCPYLAVWSLDSVVQMVSSHILLDALVHDRSLSRGLPFTCPPPEQYFNPTTYNFDATCLLNSGIVHLTCSGYQKETLSFLKKAAPCSSDIISSSYSRCLMSGLLSSRLADTQASSLSQEEQLDAILSTAVETSSLGLITGCIKQWTAEEQPGSALNLRYILDWAWNKVVHTKEELDGICAPLFDSSSNFTDPQTMQLLQHSQRLLSNLSTIFHCLLSEAQELTQKGLVGLMNKNMVSSLISKYAQVVLWFCRTGLLPEGSDDDALQISRPFYTHAVISNYYTIRREELTRLAKGKWCADCLMIDGLVRQCGDRLTNLWKRDEGGTGQYPPPTLHALLDIYLLDSIDEAAKHAIVIYLLLDVMYSFPNKDGASVESFPTAFAIPIGLVKLVQGLWLLDHNDHQSSFELLLHPAASHCQFEWQHERVLQALMCQGQHAVALRYFHVTKPPISSTAQAKLCLSVLLHNRCLIEAWSLLRQHSNRLNMGELLGFLYESCQELGLIKELLKLPLGLNEQECLEKFLQGTGGLQNRELLLVHYLQQANYIPALQLNQTLKVNLVNERDPKLRERSNTRNSILDQYGKVLPRVQRKLAMERAKPYQHTYAIHKEISRPQPLSTITKRSANEKVMSRAGFINNVLVKIEEVWLGKGATPQSSPAKSPRADFQSPKSSPLTLPDPFLGTPITMAFRRKSRLMDLVVHPSCQTPRPFLSPPRPPSSWVSPKSISKAPELSLLQTPQVVKRARALAASGPVFSAFTPQSILRSSLRPTPVATPSASPGRSITPPLRSKESRITFIEEQESPEPGKGIQWINGVAADSEINLLTRGSIQSKATHKTWSSLPAEEEEDRHEEVEQHSVKSTPPEAGVPSLQLSCLESESPSIHEVAAENRPSDATEARLSLSFDASQMSIRSTDTTLEYFDAPLIEEDEQTAAENDEVVTLNIKALTEKEEAKEMPPPITEQTPLLTSEDLEREEEETFEDVMETCFEQEAKIQEEVQGEEVNEQDVELINKPEDPAFDQEDTRGHDQVCNQVLESAESCSEVESQDQPATASGQDVPSEATGSAEFTEHLKPLEATESTHELQQELEQSTDLTEFVQRHLFGSDLSPPLTRSGIHNSESPAEVEEEEEEPAAGAPPVLTSQKSTASHTSSEPTGTDSHSVVSLNDSEELSSPESEDDEEEEDDDDDDDEEDEEESDEAEEEDSGSEVEIIEEVQGNGRLPPLQPSSAFVNQGHTHFLPSLSEQEAAEFSLITPGAEMKMVDEDMEGEVVMVRLGADKGGMDADEAEEQGSSYVELKPSTTLLVPLELMEGQDGLVDSSQLSLEELPQIIMPDDPRTETHSSFSLMLDVDCDKDMLPLQSDLQFVDLPTLSSGEEVTDEPTEKPEVILLEMDDPLLSGEVSENDQRKEAVLLDGVHIDGLTESVGLELTYLQTENSEANHVPEGTKQQMDVEMAEDQELGDLLVSVPTPVGELPAMLDNQEAEKDAAEEMGAVEESPTPAEEMGAVEESPTPTEEMGAVEESPTPAEEMGAVEESPTPAEEMGAVEESPTPAEEMGAVEESPTPTEEMGAVEENPTPAEEMGAVGENPTPADEMGVVEENPTPAEEMGAVGENPTPVEQEIKAEEEPTPDEIKEEEETPAEEMGAVDDKATPDDEEMEAEEEKETTVEQEIRAEEEPTPDEIRAEEEPTPDEIRAEVEPTPDEIRAEEEPTPDEIRAEEEPTPDEIRAEVEPTPDEIRAEEETPPAEEQDKPEENGPADNDPAFAPSEEMPTVEKEAQQDQQAPAEMNEENQGEIKMKKETIRRASVRTRKHKDVEEEPMSNSHPEEHVPETPTTQGKTKAPNTPTRMTTRGRTVTFISPLPEEAEEPQEDGKVEEVEISTRLPASPSRTPRKTGQNKEVKVNPSPTRRSTRKTQPEPPQDEPEEVEAELTDKDATVVPMSRAASPARRRVSQRATSTRSSRSSTKEVSEAAEPEIKEGQEDEVTDTKAAQRRGSKTPTPAKRRTTQGTTPRRSSRRTLGSSDMQPTPLEVLKEEKVHEEVFESPVRHNSRKTKTQPTEMQPEEEEEVKKPASSPSRATRQSNRNTLNVYPQSAWKTRGELMDENASESEALPEPKPNSHGAHTNSLRPARSKLWDHAEEDLPLLDSPLEVDSETPVADALIKRLQDEEEKQEGGVVVTRMVRTTKRSAKVHSLHPVMDSLVPGPEGGEEPGPGDNSFIYSPSRRRTRASRAESPGPSEESTAPVTRSRRRGVQERPAAPHDENASEEDHVEVEKAASVPKTRKTSKRTAKPRTVSVPPPITEMELISPLPSPADPVPRTLKRIQEAEAPTSTANLRRKRILDAVFTKPVTRRKKL